MIFLILTYVRRNFKHSLRLLRRIDITVGEKPSAVTGRDSTPSHETQQAPRFTMYLTLDRSITTIPREIHSALSGLGWHHPSQAFDDIDTTRSGHWQMSGIYCWSQAYIAGGVGCTYHELTCD